MKGQTIEAFGLLECGAAGFLATMLVFRIADLSGKSGIGVVLTAAAAGLAAFSGGLAVIGGLA